MEKALKSSPSLGLDIGGSSIKAIVVQLPDQISEKTKFPSDAHLGPEAVRAAVKRAGLHFREKKVPFEAVGIGCAGSVDGERGIVRNSPNFAHWKDVPLKDWVEADLGVPVIVENDADCAAYGEWKLGNGAGTKNMVLLTLGTGIGGGLILNGQLFRGSTGTGGELGHLSLYADGEKCPCGNRGCFERYCSGSALTRATGLEPKVVLARASEPQLTPIVRKYMADLKVGLVSIGNVFDPDKILLGGGVAPGVEPFMKDIRNWVKEHAFPAVASHVQIEFTRHANSSGAIGAALLALLDQRRTT